MTVRRVTVTVPDAGNIAGLGNSIQDVDVSLPVGSTFVGNNRPDLDPSLVLTVSVNIPNVRVQYDNNSASPVPTGEKTLLVWVDFP